MAEEKKKNRRLKKKPETVRERTKKADGSDKKRRLKQAKSAVRKPVVSLSKLGKKEYHLPISKNKQHKALHKSRRLTPKPVTSAWGELKQVVWPTRAETWKLTLAVVVFALVFGALVAAIDYVLENIFRKVIL